MVRVMLICNAGMSTAMLAQKINKNSDGYCYVEAFGEGEFEELIPSIKKVVNNRIPVSYINPVDYGMMKVDHVIAQIKEILEG